MKTIIIFGGESEIAKEIEKKVKGNCTVNLISRKQVDITKEKQVADYLQSTKYDVIINCAGSLIEEEIIDGDSDSWVKVLEVNAIGTYYISKHTFKNNPNANLVLLSSTAAFNSYPNWTSYCIGKNAQVKIAHALIERKYSVVCYCPGAIDTKFRKNTKVVNKNLMTLSESVEPIIKNLQSEIFKSGVFMYRKGQALKEIRNESI